MERKSHLREECGCSEDGVLSGLFVMRILEIAVSPFKAPRDSKDLDNEKANIIYLMGHQSNLSFLISLLFSSIASSWNFRIESSMRKHEDTLSIRICRALVCLEPFGMLC